MPRLCVSIPVHEAPAVVLDQIGNLRAFLPADTLVVLHLSAAFSEGAALRGLVDDGVLINPVSLDTQWGDTAPAHNANFRYADAHADFDVFVMHASNDLYVRAGAARRVGSAAAGVHLNVAHAAMAQRSDIRDIGLAATHTPLLALGEGTVHHSQPEGIWFERELMRRMLDVVSTTLGEGPSSFRDHDTFWGTEHYCYATAAARLTADIVPPLLYSEVQGTASRRPIDEAVIWAIREGRLRERDWVDPDDPDGPYAVPGTTLGTPFQRYDFDHLYAVKRIARRYDDPLRALVRTLARVEAGAPTRRRHPGAHAVTVAARAAEVVADPALLAAAAATVGDHAPVTFLLGVPEPDAVWLVDRLVATVSALGLDGADGPDLAVELIGAGETGDAALALASDALLTAAGPQPGPLGAHLRIGPSNVAELGALVAPAAAQRCVSTGGPSASQRASTSGG